MKGRLVCAAWLFLFGAAAAAAQVRERPRGMPAGALASRGMRLIEEKNFLAFRVFLKKAYQASLTYGDWYSLQGVVNSNADKVGFDLVSLWNARFPRGKSNLDKSLEYADSLMLAKSFGEAFSEYQKTAGHLKKQLANFKRRRTPHAADQIRRINAIYPSVLHSMGRALYGAGRFNEALTVYRWIPPSYPQFRQILFERMWAAFRAGKVEESLGAIASQRSVYFSRYLSPEAYLIQTYIFRKLCRAEDLEQAMTEMKAYEAALGRNEGLSDWAGNELETRVLWNLARQQTVVPQIREVTAAEIEREKKSLKAFLSRAFQGRKISLLKDLKVAMAYAHLASLPESSSALKPIEKLTSRQQLLAQDLEIWPVDGTEEWADEVGNRYFIGESMCPSGQTQ